ncbi:conserved unknown protein [Ectocarpus siliculosus]|uniref:Cation-transporting P-type ATPase N-terminal domain-containing protein n=1 Tax=Ectocarpus siliculosus TaxID=2880 RepID=D7FLP6_ECTSI|nr:conserved unknown protein [Ectocarpus siliculosus]|eukprot:CBJ25862.1 conserved unknown protein [Ectocarpus siliculosus]
MGMFKKKQANTDEKKDLKSNYTTEDHKTDLDALLSSLGTHATQGMTKAAAEKRLQEEGKNQLTPPPETPWYINFLKELFGNKFSLLLWAGAILCFVGFGLQQDLENLYLGIVLAVVVFVTGCFSYFQNAKSDDLMKSFASMSPPKVTVVREGKTFTVESADICRGDLIRVEGGDLIPADVRIIDCSDNMVVDNAPLTGESEPQKRKTICTHDDPMETQNLAFFGTSCPEGSCAAVVCRTADNTLMGQIAGLAMSTDNEETPINKEIEHFIKIISAIAIILGVVFFILGFVVETPLIQNLVFMIGIIVANVPEGLLATVTVCLTLTAKRMHKKQVLVKNLEGVETLGSTSCICSDKTGTLTQNIMTVAQIVYGQEDGTHIEDCASSFTKGNSTYDENDPGFKGLQRCATLCNVSVFQEDSKSNQNGPVPFKKMKVQGDGSAIEVHVVKQEDKPDGERLVVMKGAPERIIDRCSEVMLGSRIVPMTPELKAQIEPPIHPKSKEGLVFLGLMALIDPPREAVPGAVGKCKTAGIKVIMVTGDHPITAQAIAYKVGILWSKTRGEIEASNKRYSLEPGDANFEDPENAQAIVVPGWEISPEMEQDKWDAILEHPQIVFARTSPQQKLVIVENNQRVGHIVAVTGDGVNDSPALKKADIGIAMGIMGSAVSKQAADMILLDDNFASIVSGVEEGRLIFDNLKKSIAYTLTSNIPEISPFICFITLGTPPPLSTVLILAIDLGTDMVPAISMSYEQAEADIMRRPPRNSAIDRLVTKKLIIYAYLQIGVIQAAAGFYTWLVVLNDYGYPPHILIGLGRGDYFGKQPLMCKFAGGGGQYANTKGEINTELNPLTDPPTLDFPLWDTGAGGYVDTCYFPLKLVDENSGTQADFDRYDSATYLDDGVDVTATDNLRSKIKSAGAPGIPIEAMQGLMLDGYFHYIPWKGRMSPFWDNDWLHWDIKKTEDATGSLGGSSSLIYFTSYPAGLYSSCLGESSLESTTGSVFAAPSAEDALKTANNGGRPTGASFAGLEPPYDYTPCDEGAEVGTKPYVYNVFCNGDGEVDACAEFDSFTMENLHYCPAEDGCSLDCEPLTSAERSLAGGEYVQCQNIANRMVQKEALQHGQASFFVAIVIVQWADLMICKTRWLSIRTQGMINSAMNFGLFFETLLAAWLCYCPPINIGLGTRNLRLVHWFPAMPFSMIIFMYDEIRKYLMRTTSPEVMDKSTGQVKRIAGWLERNTYY